MRNVEVAVVRSGCSLLGRLTGPIVTSSILLLGYLTIVEVAPWLGHAMGVLAVLGVLASVFRATKVGVAATSAHLVVRNPFRTLVIPWGAVAEVRCLNSIFASVPRIRVTAKPFGVTLTAFTSGRRVARRWVREAKAMEFETPGVRAILDEIDTASL